ncbi:MAG: 23S rRNA (pseudouridine(1915)-N(3))-methyltransferase RlmH [Proteobacteria bacterium]|nr:23S rRNA (pseudouridine(1915)-N(3))-methyltransferase RlmH [Pseudomonadota bacterium]
MRKIRVVCIGKTQDAYLTEGIKIFEKKLKRFCSFSWVFVKEAAYKKGNKNNWLAEENDRLQKTLGPGHFTIACDEKGQTHTSPKLAGLFQSIANSGHSQIDFIIGGAYGLPQEILQKANLKLSLSEMTFTHQMIRLLLIEQIYRAFTILNNIKYHHE